MVNLKGYRAQNNKVFEERREMVLSELEQYAEYVKGMNPDLPNGINIKPYNKDLMNALVELDGAIATSQMLWFMENED